jgi:hypothetical protein
MEVKSFSQIQTAMRNYIAAHQDKLTDFNDGSVLESFIEAVSRELSLLYIRCRVGFSTHLRGLPYSVFGFEQKKGGKASAKLVFSRSKPFSSDTVIPAGTIVGSGALRFITTQAGAVPSGETASSEIMASAEEAGEKYNVGAGTVKTIVSTLPSDIVSVNNPDPATGGTDGEDWSSYLERFSEYILGLSRTNGYGFQSALLATGLVRSISIDEHFPPLDGLWNMTVYLEDGSGGMTGEAIAEAKQIIDGNWEKSADGGYRAPGINIRYLTPEVVPISVNVNVIAEREMISEMDDAAIIFEVTEAAKKFVNSLKIGQEFWDSDLVVALKRISYLLDADVSFPGDIEVGANRIARLESCNVTLAVK